MSNKVLKFKPIIDNMNLVPKSVYDYVNSVENKKEYLVAIIDPNYAEGEVLCQKYKINPKMGVNCLVVKAIRGNSETYAILLVPVGYKYNMNSVVRRELNARMVSVASLDYVIDKSNMEYGSITPLGLPKEWFVFVDPRVLENEKIIIGGGYKNVKIQIPSKELLKLPNIKVLEGLAKEN